MIIHKVLNNNVVIVLNECNEEQVVTGRGLAFKKKVGDSLDINNITQVFKLESSTSSSKVQQLLQEIPIEVMESVDKIVELAKKDLGKELNDSIYLPLMDHIHNAIERQNQGIQVKNILLWDIKRFFPEEYSLGKKGLEIVNEALHTNLSKEEAGFIALHLVNSEMSDRFENIYELTDVMSQIMTIVKYHYKLAIDEQSVYFDRFRTHLKYFAYRLLNLQTYEKQEDDELFDIVKLKYPNEYSCVLKISDYLFKRYDYKVSSEEKLYLMIHIAKLVQVTK